MSGNDGGKQYVTATEAARLAGLPGRTVRYWASHGKVGTRETAGGRLVRLSDVVELAATYRQSVATPATASGGNVAIEDTEPLPDEIAERRGRRPIVDVATAKSGNTTMTLATLHEAYASELAAVRADAARELAGLAEAHSREVGAIAGLVLELRRRANGAEAEAACLAALVAEQHRTLGQPLPREDVPGVPEEPIPFRKRHHPWYHRLWGK
jgi:MerR HTH family regulatory protein